MPGFNGFKRGFQFTLSSLPATGYPGDLWYSSDDQNLYLAVDAVADGGLTPGTSASQQAAKPRLFQRSGLTIKSGPSSALPASASIGVILVPIDSELQYAFAGTGAGNPLVRFNLDLNKVLNSGLISQSFMASDSAVPVIARQGPQVSIVLFSLNG